MNCKYLKVGFLLFLVSATLTLTAEIKLPKLVSNGMVLQRGRNIKIWGWAAANEKLIVNFRNKNYSATADAHGNWSVMIRPQKAGGPFTMKIKASNEIVLKDILIGDVWICGGQSNMELTMERLKYKYADEVNNANYTFIRQFMVPDKFNFKQPQSDVDYGTWVPANREHIKEFAGVAYFFAVELYKKYAIPIGLINSALGGSPAESWISEEAIKKFPDAYAEAQKFKNDELIKEIETKDRNASAIWYKQLNELDEGLKNDWRNPFFDDHDWDQMNIPGDWADTKTGMVNGVVWFRKEFDAPASIANNNSKLELGRIVDADSVFINGVFVGTTSYQYPPRRYEIKPGVIKAGKNSIVIRIVNNGGRGGFVKDKQYLLTSQKDTVRFDNVWKYKVGAVMKPTPSQTFIRWKPVGLYNAMIAPLTNYTVKGVIWYQGEANTFNPSNYMQLMETLINDWRNQWHQIDLPFVYVQLANFMQPRSAPQESNWAALRQQQLNTLLVYKTGMAVAIDLGEWNDIHPENKKDVGIRLALEARRLAYKNKPRVSAGPIYFGMIMMNDRLILKFKNTGKGLISKENQPLKGFAIAGSDNKYVWANAKIVGKTVVVWNESVKNPQSVRYAWADNPIDANLYNKEGLPASPFTTDSFK